ncbi:type III-A CRISPR-associated RAMP protein Csm3 [Anoxybacter fermentans]|uniref:type III-A CRISPR-associated RAMP protein Csm3 n=1 Tax=Anoxybacter fermentans TaxID=1323375 RepID=UPI0013DFE450|nr:type III-A CRISPR-associated RAMP protein Csm3 [Anoxybacter fermentans]
MKGKIFIEGKIIVKTGLMIGGSDTDVMIGGIENNVIKNSEGIPYIPGSSLKGKIRCLLELAEGRYQGLIIVSEKDDSGKFKKHYNEFNNAEEYEKIKNKYKDNSQYKISIKANHCNCGECDICAIFGVSASVNSKVGRTRLYVRDAELDLIHFEENRDTLFKNLELNYTESKWENTIDRLTSAASNPRLTERVPAGARFNFNLVYNIFEDEDIDRFNFVLKGLRLLEDDYLGGSGSRGYGKIKFDDLEFTIKTLEEYEGKNVAVPIYNGEKKDLSISFEELDFSKVKRRIISESS